MEQHPAVLIFFSVALAVCGVFVLYYYWSWNKTPAKKPSPRTAQPPEPKSEKAKGTAPILRKPPSLTHEQLKIMVRDRPEVIAAVMRKWLEEKPPTKRPSTRFGKKR